MAILRNVITAAACLLLIPYTLADAPASDRGSRAALASRIDEYMTANRQAELFMGSVLVARGGQVLVSKGYGLADVDHEILNTPTTRFHIGSLDKQFTAVLILWLRERGKLTVDDPVRNHLPECPEKWRAITIRHLLGHTSGILNLTDLPDYFEKRALPSFAPQALARIREMPLRFRPGERFEYSNTNYALLHQIAERVSGRPFASLLQEVVLDPLKMADTGSYVRPGIRHLIVKRRASGYTDGRGPLEGAPWVYPFGMYSTVEDLLRWDQALAQGTLLPKTALEAEFTRGPEGYGLGWFVGNRSGHRVLTHGGNTPGFGLTFTRYPDDQVTIIVASNLDTAPTARIADDLAAMVVFGEEIRPPQRRTTIVVDPRWFSAYVGRYRHTKDHSWVITITQEEGLLWNRLSDTPGSTEMVLRPLSETRFFNKTFVLYEITFLRDREGRVARLVAEGPWGRGEFERIE
jgi:CubicO group peptidase (beta-lactamase class C family)